MAMIAEGMKPAIRGESMHVSGDGFENRVRWGKMIAIPQIPRAS